MPSTLRRKSRWRRSAPCLLNRMGPSHHLSFGRRSVTAKPPLYGFRAKWGEFYIRRRKASVAWEAAGNPGLMFRFGVLTAVRKPEYFGAISRVGLSIYRTF